MRVAVIIPTRNAEPWLDRLIPAIQAQQHQPDQWLVVDSSSTDSTVARLRDAGAQVHVIPAAEFNHGGTREWARTEVDADILIYMTQDAIPEPDCFSNLIKEFENPLVGIAYARQLARSEAGVFEAHPRLFNYPLQARSKSFKDKEQLGIKTCFSSDSCAAYRSSMLAQVGGFPKNVIGSEDAYVAGKMLLAGYHVHYAAQAHVEHSHEYSILQEFKRYFDIGVFYGREKWLTHAFGGATGEGKRFVRSEMRMLLQRKQWYWLPSSVIRNSCKFLGYRLGHKESSLPTAVKRRLSMFPGYWVNE